MQQRGRKSAAQLSIVPAQPEAQRLQPPAHLTKKQRQIFSHVLANSPHDQFRVTDGLLLARLVEAHDMAEQAACQLAQDGPVIKGKASPWLTVQEKAVRAIVALSMRLRLSPQSRLDAKTVARAQDLRASAYETLRLDDE